MEEVREGLRGICLEAETQGEGCGGCNLCEAGGAAVQGRSKKLGL